MFCSTIDLSHPFYILQCKSQHCYRRRCMLSNRDLASPVVFADSTLGQMPVKVPAQAVFRQGSRGP